VVLVDYRVRGAALGASDERHRLDADRGPGCVQGILASLARVDGQNRIRLCHGLILHFGHVAYASLREIDIPLWARNRALHYLAGNYSLSDELHHQLTQVVHGYIGRCDEHAARKAMEWMRARALDRHHHPTGLDLLLLNDLVAAGKQTRQKTPQF
jgi:hypothetical protein